MNVLSWSKLREFRAPAILENMPLYLTVDGVIRAVVVNPEDCLVLDDIHPVMKNRIKGMYRKATINRSQNKLEHVELKTERELFEETSATSQGG